MFQIDVLVNNAGSSQRAVVLDTELSVDKAVLELNTIGTVSLTKTVLPHMMDRGSGSLVVMSSVSGIIGEYEGVCVFANTVCSSQALPALHRTL